VRADGRLTRRLDWSSDRRRYRAAAGVLVACLAAGFVMLGVGAAGGRAGGSGGLIVFVSTRDGPAALYAMRPDGTHLTRLASGAIGAQSPRISPDGAAVVYEDAHYIFRVLSRPGFHGDRFGWFPLFDQSVSSGP
jgi:hypothetical protein